MAEHHVANSGRRHCAALEQGAQHSGTQVARRHVFKRPAKISDSSAACTNDNNIFHYDLPVEWPHAILNNNAALLQCKKKAGRCPALPSEREEVTWCLLPQESSAWTRRCRLR